MKQVCLPAISSMKDYERFLKSELEVCIIMDFHISLLEQMLKDAHALKKSVIVHLDLIKGIGLDEYGCEYVIQKMKADGIISTKPKVIECAKKHHTKAIQRIFLIDTRSLNKGLASVEVSRPDYVEVLPAIAYDILENIKKRIDVPLIAGGFIRSEDMIDEAIAHGVDLVSTSDFALALKYYSCNR